MKRILAIVLALAVIFWLSACSSNASNANTANNTNAGNDTNTENEAPDTAVWPDGDVKIYLSYPAGSIQDFGATGVKNWIADKGGVNVTVEYGDADGGAERVRQLAKADPDGRTMMLFGLDSISKYCSGAWDIDPSDPELFKAAAGTFWSTRCGGYALLTHKDNPYDTWEELEEYIKKNPGKVSVMDVSDKIIGIRAKAVFYGRGLQDLVKWTPVQVRDSIDGLLKNTINIVMVDELTAGTYAADSSNNVKVILNCRPNRDFSDYDDDTMNLSLIKSWPTADEVFGAEYAVKYSVPDMYFFAVPAGTPDDVVSRMKDMIDGVADDESYAPALSAWIYKYYAIDSATMMKEYGEAADIIKTIYGK